MGRIVENIAVNDVDATAPHDRLDRGLRILFQASFPRATAAKLSELPEALMGKACPADADAYWVLKR
jgi:hypothetical protein